MFPTPTQLTVWAGPPQGEADRASSYAFVDRLTVDQLAGQPLTFELKNEKFFKNVHAFWKNKLKKKETTNLKKNLINFEKSPRIGKKSSMHMIASFSSKEILIVSFEE